MGADDLAGRDDRGCVGGRGRAGSGEGRAMTARRMAAAVGCLAALVGINAYLCRGLFRVEFTGHTNSIQGLWITMGRLAGEHWLRPAWWPYQDAGVPFEHTYM